MIILYSDYASFVIQSFSVNLTSSRMRVPFANIWHFATLLLLFFTCHIYVLCVILCHGFSSDAVVNHLGIDAFTVSIGSIALLFGSYLVRKFLIFPLYILCRTRKLIYHVILNHLIFF